jgi:hypothetical protein
MEVLNPQHHPQENLTLEWQTHARYAKGHKTKRYEVPPREDIRAHSQEHSLEVRTSEPELESTGTRPQHLESTSYVVTHQIRLESTSNSFGTRRPSTLPEDSTWNPPVTPREGWLR